MSNKKYFSYIRVSTQKQGQFGTSLIEQKAAIERYAQKCNLTISRHFEERETAAKTGRPIFLEMLKELKKGKASGVIIHKIDRSARNLRDWADLGNLIDAGVEVHFAAESLDLQSRGGRLSADIQAVVASDYIRNLREEAKKGIYGRLKQGLYPFPAILGYLDTGKGNPKKINQLQAPLIKEAFELYARGDIGLRELAQVMHQKGLRNKKGGKITVAGLAAALHNPFYIGLIRIEKTGEMFAGIHQPIISKALFEQVQAVFAGKNIKKTEKHFFVFRRQINCGKCRNLYIAEKKKGHIYYRCHTKNCTRGTVKEEAIEREVLKFLQLLKLNDLENRYFKREILKQCETSQTEFETNSKRLKLLEEQIADRLSKLADAYVDEVFDKETYLAKKNQLLLEERELKEKLTNLKVNSDEATGKMNAFLELLNSASLCYKSGTPEQKRELVKTIFSNSQIKDKNVLFKPYFPFQMMAERGVVFYGGPYRDTTRTFAELFAKLFKYFSNSELPKSDNSFAYYSNSKRLTGKRNNYPTFDNL